ncbi:hypothetical protein E2E30_10985 [Sphingomonas sp. AAP5]|jgi:hypothetical protein|uniref:DUF3617 family protein n=1 Tax=Sphingomonas glacialis TaxID=658225 RepID=A0ABQ3LEA6_9SPHN|nr:MULTISPECIES: DUF3617 family protein [Sphingomonas]MDY7523056.1 DUF3617 family protein [Sphingomonas sp. 10B4]MEB0282834.1 hypothetical protein [Sphingomonas sp. 10B4]QBM76239.1 hypothetical protein E2E30_10985 [Sphingomonas sp. AAP5]GHH11673.1 hypothetical protein GCM10008023_10960 [Sphingomonas glacialis]
MQVRNVVRAMIAGLAATGGLAAAAPAGAPTLAALARIEPGEWQFKALDSDAPPRSICIADARPLIQFGHGNAQCQHKVLVDDANVARVTYVCPGTGHGQTSVKVATQRNFNLETQGILSGAPFDEQYEARRVGDCAAGVARLK